jgi:hypothetical protein
MKLKQHFEQGTSFARTQCRGIHLGFCLTAFLAVFMTLLPMTAKAARVGPVTGGTVLAPGSTTTITSATTFPLRIEANGTYTIQGNYQGNYGPPCGYAGTALTSAQATERKTPAVGANGMISVPGNTHGIYVGYGLNDVTVILKNVGLQTTTQAYAAFVIDGYNADGTTLAAAYQGHADGTNVVLQLPAGTKSFLYSSRGQVSGNRAGLEVWKGSTVYIEGDGSLLAKSADSRSYYGYLNIQPRFPDHEHPQGSPYWTGDHITTPITNSSMWEPEANGGAAGIGSGNVAGSGGNVVIRGNPTVIAIGGAHGAGIGGAWSASGASPAYHSDVLIYGGTVESWGGSHGAGIGGGCYGGNGTIVILPTSNTYSASYDPTRAMLGQMTNVIFFGSPDHSRLALYTEDYRKVNMYLDMSKNAAVRDVIERLGGGLNPSKLPLGETRNDWPATDNAYGQHRPNYADWAASVGPHIHGPHTDTFVMLLNGGFVPTNMDIAFFTDAKTVKNFSYSNVPTKSNTEAYKNPLTTDLVTYGLTDPTTPIPYPDPILTHYNIGNTAKTHFSSNPTINQARRVPRFVMVAPRYEPSVELIPATPPTLTEDYAVTDPDNKITLRIGNTGNQKLYNPQILITGDSDYELYGGSIGTLQAAVDAALAAALQDDGDGKGPYIPIGYTFDIDLRLKVGKSPGSSYDGWVLFSADNLPDPPKPKQYNINVVGKVLPPPWLYMESPAEPNDVISGPYKVRAKFHDQTWTGTTNPSLPVSDPSYPWYVKDLFISDIFVDYGTVTAVNPDLTSEDPSNPGYYSDWIIDITPNAGLPNQTQISMSVKQDAAEDIKTASTQTVSKPKLVKFSSEGPYVTFNVAEGAVLSSLDTLLIYFNGNGISAGMKDSVYIDPLGPGYFTDAGGQANLRSNLVLTREYPAGTITTLNLSSSGNYELLVQDRNYVKIGSPPPAGYQNGDYELTIPAGYIINYDGNYLPQTVLHFSIEMPEITDGGPSLIIPGCAPGLPAAGGTARIWVKGTHLNAAKGKLSILFPGTSPSGPVLPGYSDNQEVYIPAANFTDDSVYLDVQLPPNFGTTVITYNFRIRLYGRLPNTDVTPDLSVCVNPATMDICETNTSLGYRQGINAYPHKQDFEGGVVDLKLAGKNLYFLNTAPNSNPRIRVLENGAYTSTSLPVTPPAQQGDVVISVGTFTTPKNLTPNPIEYRYELWYDVAGVPTPVPTTCPISSPFVYDSTIVDTGFQVLEDEICKTEWKVGMQVANTKTLVKQWLVKQLNELPSIKSFGLTITEDDITFTDFEDAVAGYGGNPDGSYGYFDFTISLNTTPPRQITCGKGVIVPVGLPNVGLEREINIPVAEGYLIDPPEIHLHIESGTDFVFHITPINRELFYIIPKVKASTRTNVDDGITIEEEANGISYLVTIHSVRESMTILIGDNATANEDVDGPAVWSYGGKLYIRAYDQSTAVVYNALGQLVKTVGLSAGETSYAMPSGIYLVTLNGKTYKVIVE